MEATPQPEQGNIAFKVDSAVARIVIDRPSKLNALDVSMLGKLTDTFHRLAERDDVRAVVLSGSGRSFCAGADIGAYDEHTEATFLSFQSVFRAMCESVERVPMPVVAAVHGYVLGAGLILANSCDLVVAADDSKLGLPEVKIGLFGGGPRITRLLTKHQAAELMMLGEPVSASDALRLGLVNRVVPARFGGRDSGGTRLRTGYSSADGPGRHQALHPWLRRVIAECKDGHGARSTRLSVRHGGRPGRCECLRTQAASQLSR